MRYLVLSLVLILLPLTQASAATSSWGAYHALVIGNNNYDKLNDLKTAASDAKAVAQLLKSQYGFKVRLLIDATRSEVIGALAKIRAKLTPNDNLLIYYAGHGVLDEYAEEGYWLPVDASKDDPSNWISNGDITNMVRAIRAKHVMVIADSCYSGTLVRAAQAKLNTAEQRNAWLSRMNEKRSRTALVSGGLEPVIDAGGGDHSVFAKAFLDQLRDNPDVLDGQSLFTAVGRPVALESDQTPQYSDIRRSGHEGGDFLFVRLAGLSPTAATAKSDQPTRGVTILNKTPPPVAPAANPAVELAFWSSIKDSKDAGDFEAYLSEFPTGTFVVLAQRRIKKLQNTQVAALPKPAAPVVKPPSVSDSNGKWKGFLEVNQCEGFSGSPMVLVINDGELKGQTDNGVQIQGKMISPTKAKGNASHRLGFGTFKSEYVDGKVLGEWYVHNAAALALALAMPVPGKPAQASTLLEELLGLLDNHPRLKGGRDDISAADEAVGKAEAVFLPTVALTGDRGFKSIAGPAQRAANNIYNRKFDQWGLTVTQNLWDGSRTRNEVLSAEIGRESAKGFLTETR